jgi:8-oxo-dGTP pyrophosphatase MutT (NUDIX family)
MSDLVSETEFDALAEPVRAFIRRARARLLPAPPDVSDPDVLPLHGDHELMPRPASAALSVPVRQAAVLVPVVARPMPTVLLTQRAAGLTDHAGQIAFPGGKIDPADPDPLRTALREAEEEIGLAPRLVTPLGYLDPYLSRTGFRIVPAVALIAPMFDIRLNRDEVDDAFEVPLHFLMSPENHARHSREWKGELRTFHAMPYGERYIWGVTAGILHNLYERLYR